MRSTRSLPGSWILGRVLLAVASAGGLAPASAAVGAEAQAEARAQAEAQEQAESEAGTEAHATGEARIRELLSEAAIRLDRYYFEAADSLLERLSAELTRCSGLALELRPAVLDLQAELYIRSGRIGDAAMGSLIDESLRARWRRIESRDAISAELMADLLQLLDAAAGANLASPPRPMSLEAWLADEACPDSGALHTLLNAAEYLKHSGAEALALELMQGILAKRDRCIGRNDSGAVLAVLWLSAVHYQLGSYATTDSLCREALVLCERICGRAHPHRAAILDRLGWSAYKQGCYDRALDYFVQEVAVSRGEFGDAHLRLAKPLADVAYIHGLLGHYHEALSSYERTLAIYRATYGDAHVEVAYALNKVAGIRCALGDYEAARELHLEALAIRRACHGEWNSEVAASWANVGHVLEVLGDRAGARSAYERALEIRRKVFGEVHWEVAQNINALGSLAHREGDFDSAHALYAQALTTWRRTAEPSRRRLIGVLLNLGHLLCDTGNPESARSHALEAETIAEQCLPPEHPAFADLALLQARIAAEDGNALQAERWTAHAVRIRRESLGPQHPHVARALVQQSAYRNLQGKTSSATELALEAERIGREHARLTCRRLIEREALTYNAARATGLDLALQYLAQGAARDLVPDVWTAVIGSRALVLDGVLARMRRARGSPEVQATNRRLVTARERLAAIIVAGPRNGSGPAYAQLVAEARAERDDLERQLARIDADFAAELELGGVSTDSLLAALPERTRLVAYIAYESGAAMSPGAHAYAAFTLSRSQASLRFVSLGPAATIDSLVMEWDAALCRGPVGLDGGAAAERRIRDLGEKIRRKIWDPLGDCVHPAERLLIVPDGVLCRLSFAALPIGAARYLADETSSIHYLTAERDLVAACRHGDEQVAGGSGGILLIGAAPGAGAELPGARDELEELAALWAEAGSVEVGGESTAERSCGPVITRLDQAATESAFKQLAPGRRILHVAVHEYHRASSAVPGDSAAHARLGRQDPYLSMGLVLAPGLAGASAGDADGILTADEAAGLDLRGLECCVLSVCGSGRGDVLVREGAIGLQRALQLAGAKSIVASLWPVDDQWTRLWMGAFHRELRDGRMALGRAVDQACDEILALRRRTGRSTHPYYWAAFTATGLGRRGPAPAGRDKRIDRSDDL